MAGFGKRPTCRASFILFLSSMYHHHKWSHSSILPDIWGMGKKSSGRRSVWRACLNWSICMPSLLLFPSSLYLCQITSLLCFPSLILFLPLTCQMFKSRMKILSVFLFLHLSTTTTTTTFLLHSLLSLHSWEESQAQQPHRALAYHLQGSLCSLKGRPGVCGFHDDTTQGEYVY